MSDGAKLVGRGPDVEAVSERLWACPVVTIIGPGGIGKTTLANTVAAQTSSRFDQVLTIELAGLVDDDHIDHVLSRQLGFDSMEAFLVGAGLVDTLVVIDNCETALSVSQAFAAALASASDSVTVLATSRVPLGVAGEHIHVLAPLALPRDPGLAAIAASPAVQLFIERAAQAGAKWESAEAHLEAIAQIVERFDGMPLAIELAAARARVLGPADLVDLLDRQLDVLQRPSDDGPARHHSIRAAIYASYDPLDADTKRLFRSLSLVRGSVDLDIVSRLNGGGDKLATLDLLSTLVDHSLVVASDDGITSYRLLEPIRAYGLEQLDIMGETQVAEADFIDAVTGFADEVVAAALQRMSSEVLDLIANRATLLFAALEAALRHDATPDRAYRLYLPFYAPTGIARTELAVMGSRIIDRWPHEEAPLKAEALAVMAHSSMWAGHDADALARAQMALEYPDATALAKMIAYRVSGFTAGLQGDRPAGVAYLELALVEAEAFGGSFVRELQMSWASMLDAPEQSDEALVVLDAAASGAEAEQEMLTSVWAAVASAHHHVALGDEAAARRSAKRALDLSALTGAPWAACAAHRVVASVAALTTGWPASQASWSRALEAEVTIGDIEGITLTIRTAAAAAELGGESSAAEALWFSIPARRGVTALPPLFAREEQALRERHGSQVPMGITDSVKRARAVLEAPSGPVGEREHTDRVAATDGVLHFDGFEIDLDGHELRRDGERVHIEPQVFDVLAYLAQQPGRMIRKEELLDEIWGDRFVSPSALTSRIKSARAATGDDGKAQRVIRTVHGRGFMFVAEPADSART